MISDNWLCSKHKEEKITFICVGNVWHFQPLCNACIPEHTKNHPKNIKVQLQSIKQVLPRAFQLKQKVSNIFQERIKKCIFLKDQQQTELSYIKSINQKRQNFISQINFFFDQLLEQTRKQRIEQVQIQKQNLVKLTSSISEKIIFFKKEEYLDIENFCNEIKKYYFKDNIQIYVEEIDQILQQYQQKIIKYDPFIWSKDISAKTKNFMKDSYKLQDSDDKKMIKEKQEQLKKQPKKKQVGRKRCPNCKEEMQYLTQWKKHLICRNCGGKQRNYQKKV